MAESRREKKIPATFHFLYWQRRQCCNHRPLGLGAMPALGLGHCRLLGSGQCRLLGFMAFILTASKSKINDETPLNSCTLRGRSSLFREIAVLG